MTNHPGDDSGGRTPCVCVCVSVRFFALICTFLDVFLSFLSFFDSLSLYPGFLLYSLKNGSHFLELSVF